MPVYRINLALDLSPAAIRDYELLYLIVTVISNLPPDLNAPHSFFDEDQLIGGTIDREASPAYRYLDGDGDTFLFELRPGVELILGRNSTVDQIIARHHPVLRLTPLRTEEDTAGETGFLTQLGHDRACREQLQEELARDMEEAPAFEALDPEVWEVYKTQYAPSQGYNLQRAVELAERCGRLLQQEWQSNGTLPPDAFRVTLLWADYENCLTPPSCRDTRIYCMAKAVLKMFWVHRHLLEGLPEPVGVS